MFKVIKSKYFTFQFIEVKKDVRNKKKVLPSSFLGIKKGIWDANHKCRRSIWNLLPPWHDEMFFQPFISEEDSKIRGGYMQHFHAQVKDQLSL